MIAASGGRIVFAGPAADAPAFDAEQRVDCAGRWITPGLIDCHTHLVYGGNRAHEFEQRLAGASYEEIARAGGGIVSTVKATRQAECRPACRQRPAAARRADRRRRHHDRDQVRLRARPRHRAPAAAGRAPARRRARRLGPHDVSRRAYACRRDGRRQGRATSTRSATRCCRRSRAEGLADAVDAFCEGIAFSPEQTARVFAKAQGARPAGEAACRPALQPAWRRARRRFGALSADHLEYTDEDGVAAMARAGTVAVLLPGAFYFLREKQLPPIDAMRRHGVPHRARDRQQSRHLAADLAAADHEHGRDPVSPHRRRMPRRRDAQRRARARAVRPTSAPSTPASSAISPSGTSSVRPSWSTASASIRCTRASGTALAHRIRN